LFSDLASLIRSLNTPASVRMALLQSAFDPFGEGVIDCFIDCFQSPQKIIWPLCIYTLAASLALLAIPCNQWQALLGGERYVLRIRATERQRGGNLRCLSAQGRIDRQ
jgi:hypothetical protein